jgi:hypothetical protein
MWSDNIDTTDSCVDHQHNATADTFLISAAMRSISSAHACRQLVDSIISGSRNVVAISMRCIVRQLPAAYS